MFSQKYVAYFLLVLYGVPASIGPYWHSHHGCVRHAVCCAVVGGHDGDTSSCAPDDLDADHCHCELHVCVLQPTQVSDSRESVSSGDADCSDCLICRFYSCAPCIGLAIAMPPQGKLLQVLLTVGNERPAALCRFHWARGPPSVVVFA